MLQWSWPWSILASFPLGAVILVLGGAFWVAQVSAPEASDAAASGSFWGLSVGSFKDARLPRSPHPRLPHLPVMLMAGDAVAYNNTDKELGFCYVPLDLNQNCTFHCLCAARSWIEHQKPDWVRLWMGQPPQAPVTLQKVLEQGSELALRYACVVREQQMQELGVDLDFFVNPDEISCACRDGQLPQADGWKSMADVVAQACWTPLLQASSSLHGAVQLMFAHRMFLTFRKPEMEPAGRDSTGLSQKAECAPSRLRRFAEVFPEDCVLLDTPSEAALVPHKQEDTEVAPATPPPESGVVEQAEGTRPRKRTKEQLRARKAEIKKLQTGSSIAKQLGIDFHANWFPKHNFHCDKRHWIQFQLALATSSLDQLNCALCTSMVEEAEMLREQEQYQPKGRGRPAKLKAGQEELDVPLSQRLFDWLEQRRPAPGVYNVTPGNLQIHCKLCNTKVLARRQNNIYFVLLHEAQNCHWQKASTEPGARCMGVRATGDGILHKDGVLALPGTLSEWQRHGCPWSSQASVKHHAKVDEDGRLWLRRGACADGQFRIVPSSAFKSCASCQRLCLRDKFVEKLAVWGFFFDLTDLVHSMYTGNLRLQRDVWRQVQEADYSSIALRSLHMSMQDVERLDWAGCMRLFNQIVGHTPPDRQNQACRDFLAARWSWLPRTEQVLRSPDLYRRLDRHTECLGGLTNESGFTGSLVAELRAERLDAQHTCKTMISVIAKRTGLLGRNRQRTTATNIPGQSEGDLAEVVKNPCRPRLYAFQSIAWQGHMIFDVADPPHTQKNLALALRAKKRCMLCHGLSVNRGILVMGECPGHAYSGAGKQSDREAAWMLNPTDCWDGAGMAVMAFKISLVTSSWMSAQAWEPELLLEHAATGYYLLLIGLWDAMDKVGTAWQDSHWHRTTTRNSCFVCGNMIQRIMMHPPGEPLALECTLEDCSEHDFGKIKRMVGHRCPSLKALLFATQALHHSQKSKGPPKTRQGREWKGITGETAKAILDRGYSAALAFHCAINVNTHMDQVEKDLEVWWEDTGRLLLFDTTEDAQAENVEEIADGSDEEQDEKLHLLELPGKEQTMHAVHMLEKEARLKAYLLDEADDPAQPDEGTTPLRR
eukprot:s3807_g6.t1